MALQFLGTFLALEVLLLCGWILTNINTKPEKIMKRLVLMGNIPVALSAVCVGLGL